MKTRARHPNPTSARNPQPTHLHLEPLEPRILLDVDPHALFASHRTYAAGETPRSVAVGDFDSDGHQDLAVANQYSYDANILLGVGDGTFAPQARHTAGHEPRSVAVGDFDCDGNQDLAVANLWGGVSILLGLGDGTFVRQGRYTAGGWPMSVAVGDFDSDGHQDLAVANCGGNDVSILLGRGDGTFASQVRYAAGDGPWSVAVGDFDSDGHQDLAVANSGSNDVSILLGVGDGTFVRQGRYTAGAWPMSVAVGDFDSDGHQDLAVANYRSNDVSILLGRGDGTFAPQARYAAGYDPLSVAVGDFDSDGRQDLAVANSWDNDVSILLGVGDGTFAPQTRYAAGGYPCSVAVGDFDSDGHQDLAVANSDSDDVSILLGLGAQNSNGWGAIRGTVWEDANENGERDGDEPGMAGVIVFLDTNGNRQPDGDEFVTVTRADDPATADVDEAGTYEFVRLPAGTYPVRQVVPSGYKQVVPDPTITYSPYIGPPWTSVPRIDFGNVLVPSIEVTLYKITDTSGTPHTAEPGQEKDHFGPGEKIRVTLMATNTGAARVVQASLTLWGPDGLAAYDSASAGGDLPAPVLLDDSETIFFSFDWFPPASAQEGWYDVHGWLHVPGETYDVYDTTEPGANNTWGGGLIEDQFFLSLASEQSIKVTVRDERGLKIDGFHYSAMNWLPWEQWSDEVFVRDNPEEPYFFFAPSDDFQWATDVWHPHTFTKQKPRILVEIIHDGEVVCHGFLDEQDTFPVPETGLYEVLVMTTFQVDAEPVDYVTDVPVHPTEQYVYPELPDALWEKGAFDIVSVSRFNYNGYYAFRYYPRYTYQVVSGTKTHVSPGEEDEAFVCLPRGADILGRLAGAGEQVHVDTFPANIENTGAVGSFVTGALGNYLQSKYALPAAHSALLGVGSNIIWTGLTEWRAPTLRELVGTTVASGASFAASAGIRLITHASVPAFVISVLADVMIEALWPSENLAALEKDLVRSVADDLRVATAPQGWTHYDIFLANDGIGLRNVSLGTYQYGSARAQPGYGKAATLPTGAVHIFEKIPKHWFPLKKSGTSESTQYFNNYYPTVHFDAPLFPLLEVNGEEKETEVLIKNLFLPYADIPPLYPGADRGIKATLASHSDLHAYDAEGRHVGPDYETGAIELNIPGASFMVLDADGNEVPWDGATPDEGLRQVIVLPAGEPEDYRFELVGTSEGLFDLTIEGVEDGSAISSETYSATVAAGDRLAVTANARDEDGQLVIDYGQLGASPGLAVAPDSAMATVDPGDLWEFELTVLETDGAIGLQDVTLSCSGLWGAFSEVSGADVSFSVDHFDVAAGGQQTVMVTIPAPANFEGEVWGSILVESADGSRRSVALALTSSTYRDLEITITGDDLGPLPTVGQTGNVSVEISNSLPVPIDETVGVALYASSDDVIDAGDTLVGTANVDLAALTGATPAAADVPVDLSGLGPGEYYLLARVDTEDAVDEHDEANNDSVGTPLCVGVAGEEFGGRIVGEFQDGDGTNVTVRLNGTGSACLVENAEGGTDIHITGTDARSRLMILNDHEGNARANVGTIVVEGPLASLLGRTTDLAGSLTVTGGLEFLELGDLLDGHRIEIGPPASAGDTLKVVMGRVADCTFISQVPIRTLMVTDWWDTNPTVEPDIITAPSLHSLVTTGDRRRGLVGNFNASLELTGGTASLTLGEAKIAGQIIDGYWDVDGSVGRIVAGLGTTGLWTLDAEGDVGRIDTRAGGIVGCLAARSFGEVFARGTVRAKITAVGGDSVACVLRKLDALGGLRNTTMSLGGDVGRVFARGVTSNVTADWTAPGAAGRWYALGHVDGLSIGGDGAPTSLRVFAAGDVADATLLVEGPIGTVQATRWQAGSIAAHTLKLLTTRGDRRNDLDGDFQADLTLSGVGATRNTLGNVRIAGELSNAQWAITGDVGSIRAGDATEWTLDVNPKVGSERRPQVRSLTLGEVSGNTQVDVEGGIRSLRAISWDGGSIEADWIGYLRTTGSRREQVPGDFSAGLSLDGNPDQRRRTLSSATIAGTLTGDWTISGDVGSIRAGDATGWSLDVNSEVRSLRLGKVSGNTEVDVEGGIRSLRAVSWDGGSIKADWIGSLRTTGARRPVPDNGDFAADITLSGNNAPRGRTLSSASIAGSLTGGAWNITAGNVGTVRALSFEPGWTLTAVVGEIRSLYSRGDFSSDVTARSLASLYVRGNLAGARLDLTQPPEPRTYAARSISVRGWIADSTLLFSGNVRSVRAGGMRDSALFAGVTATGDQNGDGVLDLPDPGTQLALGAGGRCRIGSLRVTGIRGEEFTFINTNLAAAEFGYVYVRSSRDDNDQIPFGIAADTIDRASWNGERFRGLDEAKDSLTILDREFRLT